VSNEFAGIIIVGPTASGKSRLALALAQSFRGEIVSCDALQIYRYMDIGTAKASSADRALVPHHMLDIRYPDEDFSAGDYQRIARQVIAEISARGNLPFVVGGSGFYLRALIDGLFEGPARVPALRERMRQIIERRSPRVLHRALRRVDPESAHRIAENDSERIIRAYEVYLVSSKPMSWWQKQPRSALQGYRWLKIGINLPRALLYRKIDQRVEEMFRSGFIEEVQALLSRFPRQSQALKAIGYRQVADYLEGKLSLQQALESTKIESRHYAKRQLTWLRADPGITWLDGSGNFLDLKNQAAELIKSFLDKQCDGTSP